MRDKYYILKNAKNFKPKVIVWSSVYEMDWSNLTNFKPKFLQKASASFEPGKEIKMLLPQHHSSMFRHVL